MSVYDVITTRSRAGVVWFAYDGGAGAEISPETARQFARHLTLHAEKAEILRRRGNGARVGERESQTGRGQTIREAAQQARDKPTGDLTREDSLIGREFRCVEPAYGLMTNGVYRVVAHEGSFVGVEDQNGRRFGLSDEGEFAGCPTIAFHRFTAA